MSKMYFLMSVVVVLVVVLGLAKPGVSADTALLLQQSPANGGTVTPTIGVHNFELNTVVTLMAIPEPGYRFVYWLGDVSDPESNNTVASLDTPKIIIAVFERDSYEYLPEPDVIRSLPAPELIGTPQTISSPSFSGGGTPPPPDNPPEVPEPVSLLLLAAGGLLTRRLVGRNRK